MAGRNGFVEGQNAVQLFYIISGFLISYVLIEAKSHSNIKTFYINRYLRLFPIYFGVAILTGVALMFSKHASFAEVYSNAPISTLALLVFSKMFIFFKNGYYFRALKMAHFCLSIIFTTAMRRCCRVLLFHKRGLWA
jgi:peptidoglycan/LPS O-acetylase OafA/YrhL